MASQRAPFPTDQTEFGSDSRISFSKEAQNFVLEDELGEEWEWLPTVSKWVPAMDEALAEQQRSVYKVEGIDENEPAFDPTKKRKAAQASQEGTAKKQKQVQQAPPRREHLNTAIYITGLPTDADEAELYNVFSKYGMIAESADTDKPRIKLYFDDQGESKGEALIVYFRPESVRLAIELLDESDFRLGSTVPGPLRVMPADQNYKSQKDDPSARTKDKKKGPTADRDRKRRIQKHQEMNKRLAWDDDDDPSAHPSATTGTGSRWERMMVIKGMFTLEELAEDPSLYLDIKDDLRQQCEEFGKVTSVVLYDQEPEGIMTVRFGNAQDASECVRKMDGRGYEYRKLEAYIAKEREKFKKTSKTDADAEDDEKRLEAFSKDIGAEGANG